MPTATPIEMKAKFGLSLSTRAILFDWGTLADLLDMAEMAEQSGYFHGVWVGGQSPVQAPRRGHRDALCHGDADRADKAWNGLPGKFSDA